MSQKRPPSICNPADVINFLERKERYKRKVIRTIRLPTMDAEESTTSDIGLLKVRNKIMFVVSQCDYGANPPRVDTVTFDLNELPDVIETLTDAYEFVTKRDGEES